VFEDADRAWAETLPVHGGQASADFHLPTEVLAGVTILPPAEQGDELHSMWFALRHPRLVATRLPLRTKSGRLVSATVVRARGQQP
jgi:hypothetical protein